jgi:hypothetical protein
MLVEQYLVEVGGDQFALWNENDETLFSVTCHNTDDHYFCWAPLRKG